MVEPSIVEFKFGRYDQFTFLHRGKLAEHPVKDKMVHACRVCGDPCTGRKKFYCSTSCRIHWYKNITSMTQWSHWRNKALERDSYTCQECGISANPRRAHWSTEPNLEVDHIIPVKEDPQLEFELDNLRTLCRDCHVEHGARPDSKGTEERRRDNRTLDAF